MPNSSTSENDLNARLHWVFMGDQGLRAGWANALYALICALEGLALYVIARVLLHGRSFGMDVMTPGVLAIGEGVACLVLAGALGLMLRIEGRSLASVGYGLRRAVPRLLEGVALGLLAMAVLVVLIWSFGGLRFDGVVVSGLMALWVGVRWAFAFVLLGVAEESAFRGYLHQTLARGMNFRWATAIMGLSFVAAHVTNPNESVLGLLLVFGSAVLFSYGVWRTGAIWWGVGFHAAWDWTQTFFLGLADSGQASGAAFLRVHTQGADWVSGGATGIEASAFAVPVVLAGMLYLRFAVRQRDLAVDWRP
jgi:membrane protease YdiL (CAAX protease family)